MPNLISSSPPSPLPPLVHFHFSPLFASFFFPKGHIHFFLVYPILTLSTFRLASYSRLILFPHFYYVHSRELSFLTRLQYFMGLFILPTIKYSFHFSDLDFSCVCELPIHILVLFKFVLLLEY